MKTINIYNDLGLVEPIDFMYDDRIREMVINVFKDSYNAKVRIELMCLVDRNEGKKRKNIVFHSGEYKQIKADYNLMKFYYDMAFDITAMWTEFQYSKQRVWNFRQIDRLVITINDSDNKTNRE